MKIAAKIGLILPINDEEISRKIKKNIEKRQNMAHKMFYPYRR